MKPNSKMEKKSVPLFTDNPKSPPLHEIIRIYGFCKNEKEKMLMKTAWEFALRVGELVKIRVSYFDLTSSNPKLILPESIKKKRRGGTIDIFNKKYKCELQEYIEKNGLERHDYLFNYTKQRKPYTSHHIIRVFNNIGKRAYAGQIYQRDPINVKNNQYRNVFHPHMLRHSRARYLIQNGVFPYALQSFLRHSDIVTTYSYYGTFFEEENHRQLKDIPSPEGL
jgi:integrase